MRLGGVLKAAGGAAILATAGAQMMYGDTKDVYEYTFITTKNRDDLAGFYGSEEFMDIFCVMPFAGKIMMRGATFDEEGTVHTTGIPGEMLVSMVFSDEDDEETGETAWFNKRERFKDVCFGYTCWDMITNFGFHTLPDGRVEVYHRCEYFKGYLPPVSLAVGLAFRLHAQFVIWATEHHIEKYAFTSETDDEEAIEELSRRNMLWNILKNEVWRDTKAMLFGWTKSSDDRRDRPSTLALPKEEREAKAIEGEALQARITRTVAKDIQEDKAHYAKHGPVYSEKGLGYQNQGGNAAWEALRATNNPEAYQKASRAALSQFENRRIARRATRGGGLGEGT